MFGIEHICRILDIPDLNRLLPALQRLEQSGKQFALNLTLIGGWIFVSMAKACGLF